MLTGSPLARATTPWTWCMTGLPLRQRCTTTRTTVAAAYEVRVTLREPGLRNFHPPAGVPPHMLPIRSRPLLVVVAALSVGLSTGVASLVSPLPPTYAVSRPHTRDDLVAHAV